MGVRLVNNFINQIKAIESLRPSAKFSMSGLEIDWFDTTQTQPTQEEIDNEVVIIQAEYDSQQYARDRQPEYPPVTDYLDGIVKGDTAQVDKYVADCLAVKAKYPKP